ncbi:hypothetical protein WN55_01948 [Dufourea novaeangliae]|uniref:Uncharacterized protein n=2 Tax=Dufourea novaeangliae TaxID=178035 RepID=A0A154PF90_DUFNO|nr:hypothetical protein WN55_01948 [Dufourea novaeangliae]
MPIFPELSWHNIKSELVKCHSTFTSANVVQLMKKTITERRLREKNLKDRLITLQLIDISWHSNKKTWYGYSLKGSVKPLKYFKPRNIEQNLQNYCEFSDIEMNVKAYAHNGIIYVSFNALGKSATRRRRRIQNVNPIVFALFLGQTYFFINKQNVKDTVLNAVVTGMGYNKSEQINLKGKNLKSLSKMCWQKKEGALNYENINDTVKYKNTSPEIKATGIDFTQHRQRKKFAEECFGDNPATLELLVINGSSKSFVHEEVATKLADETMRATCEFRGPNIAVLLTKLIERQIINMPVPYYISNFMTLGENEFVISNG